MVRGNQTGKGGDKELPLGAYEHYKGGVYEVIGVANHSETLEKMVVYKHGDGEHIRPTGLSISSSSLPQLWVRPLAMFTELVEVNGEKVPRFRYTGKR